MRLATWNINSIRACEEKLLTWLGQEKPDVLCLQETKVEDAGFPAAALRKAGYEVAIFGQRSYNGVALANTPNGLAYATTQVAHKMLAGDGVKINTLSIDPPLATNANLTTYVTIDPSWTINSAGTATGPSSLYVSNSFIDAIFTKS